MADQMGDTTKRPKHILKLSLEEKREFLSSFDRILSDIDGVVWNLGAEIVGASQGFQALKKAGKPIHLITNNSVRKSEIFEEKFKAINMDVNLNEIIHPADSIVYYLKSIKFEGLIYVIGSSRIKDILKDAGYQYIDGPNKSVGDSFADLATQVFGGETVRAVIIDVDFDLSWTKLIRAQIFLLNPDCLLIAGATDMLLPVASGTSILGPGYFVKVLEDVSKRRAITLGKPGIDLAKMLVPRLNITQTHRVLMVGDALEQDIGFAKTCGFQTLAVLTGASSLNSMLTETHSEWIPDYYADSMADFVVFMNDVK